MNLNTPRHPWFRLTAAARQIRDERDTTAPYGFATRVAALACGQQRRVSSLVERFALRAVGLSCLLALLSVVLNYTELTTTPATTTSVDDFMLPIHDPVAVVLDYAE